MHAANPVTEVLLATLHAPGPVNPAATLAKADTPPPQPPPPAGPAAAQVLVLLPGAPTAAPAAICCQLPAAGGHVFQSCGRRRCSRVLQDCGLSCCCCCCRCAVGPVTELGGGRGRLAVGLGRSPAAAASILEPACSCCSCSSQLPDRAWRSMCCCWGLSWLGKHTRKRTCSAPRLPVASPNTGMPWHHSQQSKAQARVSIARSTAK